MLVFEQLAIAPKNSPVFFFFAFNGLISQNTPIQVGFCCANTLTEFLIF